MPETTPRIWQVGALCRAVADALDTRFNPVAVRGEISGFARASSGHCYFSLKDQAGQIRCAMFKRASSLLDFPPRDGQLVEVRGRLGVYEPKGDLQLIVEAMRQAGAGALFEQFLRLKAKLDAEGLFDTARKRELPPVPRGIGIVTSLGAAALYDVVSTLQRRVPHIPVVLAAASVQGANAPSELARALTSLYRFAPTPGARLATERADLSAPAAGPLIDVILLVRGGGSMEDLWAFNDEALARVIAASPVPIVSGVGHETDFTIADFVADLRAPTPTAAAELVAQAREVELAALGAVQNRMLDAVARHLDMQGQRLDSVSARFGRPSALAAVQRMALRACDMRLGLCVHSQLKHKHRGLTELQESLPAHLQRGLERAHERLVRAELRLGLLDPSLVLQRGYAWLTDGAGRTITSPDQTHGGQSIRATVADGTLDLLVPVRS